MERVPFDRIIGMEEEDKIATAHEALSGFCALLSEADRNATCELEPGQLWAMLYLIRNLLGSVVVGYAGGIPQRISSDCFFDERQEDAPAQDSDRSENTPAQSD